MFIENAKNVYGKNFDFGEVILDGNHNCEVVIDNPRIVEKIKVTMDEEGIGLDEAVRNYFSDREIARIEAWRRKRCVAS
jgi:hypothetical protein